MGMSLMWSEPCVASLRLRNEHFSICRQIGQGLPPPLGRHVSFWAHGAPHERRCAIFVRLLCQAALTATPGAIQNPQRQLGWRGWLDAIRRRHGAVGGRLGSVERP